MARLEYRLFDQANEFPVLYFYENIPKNEVLMRFTCDYFVKEMTVYEKTSCAVEADAHVIYVRVADDEHAGLNESLQSMRQGIVMEVREFSEEASRYPVVHVYQFTDGHDALLHLYSNFLYLNGEEWEKTSAEVDEDRKVYVIYAQRSEGGANDGREESGAGAGTDVV